MRQWIPNQTNTVGDLGTDSIVSIWASRNTDQAFTADKIRLIAIGCPTPFTADVMCIVGDDDGAIWTLYKNDVATAITATSSGGFAIDSSHSVSYALGDRIYYRRQGPARLAHLSTPLNTNLEVDTSTNLISWYGSAGSVSGDGIGGALGSAGAAGTVPISNTVSISPIAGNVTRNVIFCYFAAIDATKGFTAVLWKNGIIQDGSGGSVDTRVNLMATAANTYLFNSSTFSLPISIGDTLDFQFIPINPPVNAIISTVGNSVAFTSSTAGEFAICGSHGVAQGPGGPYDALSVFGSVPQWWGLTEDAILGAKNSGSVNAFSITRLQWFYLSAYPAGTGPVVFKVMKNGANPANQPTITVITGNTYVQDSDASHVVQITQNDTWSLNATPTNTGSVQAHWSFAGFFSLTPTPPSGNGGGGGIYQLVPGKLEDTIYESFTPEITQDYKIP